MRHALLVSLLVIAGCGREAENDGRVTQVGPASDASTGSDGALDDGAPSDAAPSDSASSDSGPFHTNWLLEGDGIDLSLDRVVARNGAVFISGGYADDVAVATLGGEPLPDVAGPAGFIQKRRADGSTAWTTSIPSKPGAYTFALVWLAVDSAGATYVTGGEADPTDGGGFPSARTFLIAMTPTGSIAWRRDDLGVEWGPVSATRDGVVVFGVFSGTVDFGDGPRTATPRAAFVVSYASDGTFRWFHTLPALPDKSVVPEPIAPAHVIATSDDRIFLSGNFKGTIDLGAGPMTAKHSYDRFVVALAADGSFRWALQVDGIDTTYPHIYYDLPPLQLDKYDRLYFGAPFHDSITLGATTLTAPGDDFFITSFTSDGVPVSPIRAGASGLPLRMYASFAVDPEGGIVVAGTLDGPTFDYDAGPYVDGGVLPFETTQLALVRYAPDLSVDWTWITPRPTPTMDRTYLSEGFVAFPSTSATTLALTGYFTDTFVLGDASVIDPSSDPQSSSVFLGEITLDR